MKNSITKTSFIPVMKNKNKCNSYLRQCDNFHHMNNKLLSIINKFNKKEQINQINPNFLKMQLKYLKNGVFLSLFKTSFII